MRTMQCDQVAAVTVVVRSVGRRSLVGQVNAQVASCLIDCVENAASELKIMRSLGPTATTTTTTLEQCEDE